MTKIEALFKIKIKDYYKKINDAFHNVNDKQHSTYEVTDRNIINAEKDFSQIIIIIDSCKTFQQCESALNLIALFRKKHPFAIVIECILQRKILNKQLELSID